MSEPKTDPIPEGTVVSLGGFALLLLALFLLALGGAAAAANPTEFDLWFLAVGILLLAGGFVLIARNRARAASEGSRGYSRESAPLAGAPAFSGPGPELDSRGVAVARGWVTSDTIAGQYAEAARLRASRGTTHRGGPPSTARSGIPSFWEPVGPAGSARPGEPTPRSPLEVENERLRDRVAYLESTRENRARANPSAGAFGWPGPSQCVGCGTLLVGGPGEGRCPNCRRPMCSNCRSAVPEGPAARFCPDCRAPELSSSDPLPTRPPGATPAGPVPAEALAPAIRSA